MLITRKEQLKEKMSSLKFECVSDLEQLNQLLEVMNPNVFGVKDTITLGFNLNNITFDTYIYINENNTATIEFVSRDDNGFSYDFHKELNTITAVDSPEILALVKEINQAIVTKDADYCVKNRTSRSKWYDNAGELNGRSQYHYMIPTSQVENWKKVNEWKKARQDSKEINWLKYEINYVIDRIADHERFNTTKPISESRNQHQKIF